MHNPQHQSVYGAVGLVPPPPSCGGAITGVKMPMKICNAGSGVVLVAVLVVCIPKYASVDHSEPPSEAEF